MIGVLIGTWLSGYLDGTALTAIFAAVALLVAANMAFRPQGVTLAESLPRPRSSS